MPYHYPALRAQIAADLVASQGEATIVKFGRPRKPIRTYPHAVVLTTLTRSPEGRSIREEYEFAIEIRLPLPDPQDVDLEAYAIAAADELVMRLAPYSGTAVPAPFGPYAGVADSRHVSAVTPGEDQDTDAFVSVIVDFSCAATVWQ